MNIRIVALPFALAFAIFGSSAVSLADDLCPQGREVSTQQEQYCLVEKDGKEVKNGIYKEFYSNGNKKTLGEYAYGEKSGAWTFWNDKGQKVLEEGYQNGLKQGSIQKWYANGQLAFSGQYENDKPVGERLEWYMNGNKMAENIYSRKGDDILAVRKTWYEGGQEQSLAEYINGKLDGMEKRWHKDGRVKSEIEYKNGQKNGLCRESYPNGNQQSVNHYIMGKKDGSSIEWYDNGQKKSEGAWKNGMDGKWTYWEKDGTVREEVTYKEGKKI